MAVQIVVPDPSLDQPNSIAQGCIAPTAQRSLSYPADEAQLPAFVAQLDALTDAHIPPACRADLLAIVEAIAAR